VSGAFDVTFICTGNRFRSALAAALLLAERPPVPLRVGSFGTLELASAPALPEAIELARRFGVDLGEHRSRTLTGADLASSDLVLGFERAHVASAVVDAGARRDVTFTLPEIVQLLEAAPEPPAATSPEPAARARARIQAAAAARPVPLGGRPAPELTDPMGRPKAVQRKIGEETRALVSELARRLFQ
jgi:protein-tyrosine phosphatase